MSDDNPATDPEVKPPTEAPDRSEAPTQPTTPQAPIPVVVEEQKPESWIEKHRHELESFYDERESKRTTKTETRPEGEGKEDSNDGVKPDTTPKPAKRKRVKLRSLKRS